MESNAGRDTQYMSNEFHRANSMKPRPCMIKMKSA